MWTGIDLTLKPVFLGGIMKAAKNKPPAALPARGEHILAHEWPRFLNFFDLNYAGFPSNMFTTLSKFIIQAQRALYALCSNPAAYGMNTHYELLAIVEVFTIAMWKESERSEGGELVVDKAWMEKRFKEAHGHSSGELKHINIDALLELTNFADPKWKAETLEKAGGRKVKEVKDGLVKNTEEVLALGAFGMPVFVGNPDETRHKGEMFFGSDRFDQMAFHYGLPYLGPVPSRPTTAQTETARL